MKGTITTNQDGSFTLSLTVPALTQEVLVFLALTGVDFQAPRKQCYELTGLRLGYDGYPTGKLDAIKTVREITGLGLRESKEIVDNCNVDTPQRIVPNDDLTPAEVTLFIRELNKYAYVRNA